MLELVEKKFNNLYFNDFVLDRYKFKLKANNVNKINNDKDDINKIGKILDMNIEKIKNLNIGEIKVDETINLLLEKKVNFEKYRSNIEKSYNELMNKLNHLYKYLNILINNELDNYLKKEEIKTLSKGDNNSIFQKVKEILDKTIENVKKVAKENINKDSDEKDKLDQINKIKNITNEAIDKINKLTTFIVEQSYELIRKLNENNI
jgi:hypothetical protein